MESYFLFVIIATITVLSPGPGVVLTLTNSIRFGVSGAISGVLGIAFGTFIVATASATSLGIILATSSMAFSIMKYIGAAYLIYLGIKLWHSPSIKISGGQKIAITHRRKFVEGLALQLTNPKAVFFFMSVSPQFVDFSSDYIVRFLLLVFTYSGLVILIHVFYAYLAKSARTWLSTEKGALTVNRLGGGTFILFGVGLASANK